MPALLLRRAPTATLGAEVALDAQLFAAADCPDAAAVEQGCISGVARPAREPGDAARTAGVVLLFVPRLVVDLAFMGTWAAVGLIQDEQLVPRVRDIMSTPAGELWVFPTLFAETRRAANVGARLVSTGSFGATTFRCGWGGPDDWLTESRLQLWAARTPPVVVGFEGLYERESEIELWGVGQTPARDERNAYRPGATSVVGMYRERKTRLIGSAGWRIGQPLEVFLSTSATRRQIDDTPGSGRQALSRVFAPQSTPGAFQPQSWASYSELAGRVDTRPTRGRPSPGVLVEAYGGGALGLAGEPVSFVRTGGRLAGFFPIYRRTNILSPRMVFDNVMPLGGLAVPFAELVRQPDFRGFDTRRDLTSLVFSLDYSWPLVDFMGARLFFDGATMASGPSSLTIKHLEQLRLAAGIGIDLYTNTSQLGRLTIAGSPEGARVLLSLGVPAAYGDRQHRE